MRKRAGRMAQMAEHLPSKTENVSSNPNITTKKKKKKNTDPSDGNVRINGILTSIMNINPSKC
jgi:hypothetical protein